MAKKKIKRLLKKAAPLLAVAGLGKAFMDARNRRAMINSADANDGFRAAFTKPNMLDISGPAFIKPRMMTPQDMANDQMFLDAAAAKGGRIVKTEKGGKAVRRKKKTGIQIKGFGKARRG